MCKQAAPGESWIIWGDTVHKTSNRSKNPRNIVSRHEKDRCISAMLCIHTIERIPCYSGHIQAGTLESTNNNAAMCSSSLQSHQYNRSQYVQDSLYQFERQWVIGNIDEHNDARWKIMWIHVYLVGNHAHLTTSNYWIVLAKKLSAWRGTRGSQRSTRGPNENISIHWLPVLLF